MNFIAIFVAALVPMILGFIYYHPKVLGGVWMAETGLTEEKMKGGNMALVFSVSFVLSLMLSISVMTNVVHQLGVDGALYYAQKDPARMAKAEEVKAMFVGTGEYANDGRSIKHGAIHGIIVALFFMLPILGTNALFERKSFKYILVNAGYWTICLAIMGAIICAWK
jgi:hypothetical protein